MRWMKFKSNFLRLGNRCVISINDEREVLDGPVRRKVRTSSTWVAIGYIKTSKGVCSNLDVEIVIVGKRRQ